MIMEIAQSSYEDQFVDVYSFGKVTDVEFEHKVMPQNEDPGKLHIYLGYLVDIVAMFGIRLASKRNKMILHEQTHQKSDPILGEGGVGHNK